MDMMSSPDPLNASLQGSILPSTRRVTRSQSSQRFLSTGPSPRKQKFTLDVGNELSPQKILVTVEADESGPSNVNRRLFQSSTPQRSTRTSSKAATTTTVPLRGLTDDESGPATGRATPKRKPRLPKAGTPAATRKRRTTPTTDEITPKKTRKTPRRTKAQKDALTSDISIDDSQATPKASVNARKRKTPTPSKADTADQVERPKKRGRPRKLVEDVIFEDPTEDDIAHVPRVVESIEVATSPAPTASHDDHSEGYARSIAPAEDSISVATSPLMQQRHDSPVEEEEDIWMATLSDAPAPGIRRRSPRFHSGQLESSTEQREAEHSRHTESHFAQQEAEYSQHTESDLAQSEADVVVSRTSVDVDHADPGSEAESASEELQDPAGKDTVMLGEEFTMISVGSLPSMQPNSSMIAAQHQEIGDETSLIINQTLESVRRSLKEREINPIVDSVEESAASTATLSAEKSFLDMENSLISAPPKSPQVLSRSPRRAKAQPLSRQLALKSLQKGDDLESPQHLSVEPEPSGEQADASAYDDSFSEIPDAVLEAATPKPMRLAVVEDANGNETDDVADPSVEEPSMVTHSDPRSDSKLLTPDETPSPTESDQGADKGQQSAPKSLAQTEMRSSPPVFTFSQPQSSDSMSRRSNHNSSETPAVWPHSAQIPPRMEEGDQQAKRLIPPESATRPTLSPIVRAGRALQFVTSDPPTPPGRGSVLGSPFRGSIGKPSQSPTSVPPVTQPTQSSTVAASGTPAQPQSAIPQPTSSWSKAFAPFGQIRNLVAQGAQMFSPRAAPVRNMEDPFGPDVARGVGSSAFHNSSSGPSIDAEHESRRAASMTSSTRADPPNEDEMSWQADDSLPRLSGGDMSGTISSTVRARRGSSEPHDMDVDVDMGGEMDSGNDGANNVLGQAEDDEDIWAVEADRPAPAAPRFTAAPAPFFNPPRRSRIPSPWRQKTRRSVYSDELNKIRGNGRSTSNDNNIDFEEFSMLSQTDLAEDTPWPQEKNLPASEATKKVDLSAFFSSPALLPDAQPPGTSINRFNLAEPSGNAKPQALSQTVRFSPPQTTFAAFVRPSTSPESQSQQSSPAASMAAQSPSQQQSSPAASVPQKDLRIGSRPRIDLFSPIKSAPKRRAEEAFEGSESPLTPERSRFGHVPQKRNFTPRLGLSGNKLLFQPVSNSQPSASLNNQRDVFTDSDAETEDADETFDETFDESSFIQADLKPLPDKNLSPTKSCMRSPLKPKTPGRVVEFASSTLSPLAQAQARAERRASMSSPEKQVQRPIVFNEPLDADKENQPDPSLSSSPSASPSQSPSPVRVGLFSRKPATTLNPFTSKTTAPPSRLSQTQWTRDHWVRLDELLRERRSEGALQFQLRHSAKKQGKGRGGSALLGKTVKAQGETMALEQWHLDIVEAFRAEVGGWDDAVLARRLFALMVGEGRRRRGEVPVRRGAGVVI